MVVGRPGNVEVLPVLRVHHHHVVRGCAHERARAAAGDKRGAPREGGEERGAPREGGHRVMVADNDGWVRRRRREPAALRQLVARRRGDGGIRNAGGGGFRGGFRGVGGGNFSGQGGGGGGDGFRGVGDGGDGGQARPLLGSRGLLRGEGGDRRGALGLHLGGGEGIARLHRSGRHDGRGAGRQQRRGRDKPDVARGPAVTHVARGPAVRHVVHLPFFLGAVEVAAAEGLAWAALLLLGVVVEGVVEERLIDFVVVRLGRAAESIGRRPPIDVLRGENQHGNIRAWRLRGGGLGVQRGHGPDGRRGFLGLVGILDGKHDARGSQYPQK